MSQAEEQSDEVPNGVTRDSNEFPAGRPTRGDDRAPVQDEEFGFSNADNIQVTGFLEHNKLPHYVDLQRELNPVRKLRREAEGGGNGEAME